ncbi:DNA polymerase III subunit beta [Candidatus Thiodiazotropha sp. CDECU1]|uniref:DNA polymerase III subunit beta n=1 Tax=Candidatus Thiodiazotropha sp. CDECU1 TaxID=3065865 RepID=UPI00292E0720|nr:DNA polymerase III subunit beta [Candidatus Thiodiazotropha sp. CDECU1]
MKINTDRETLLEPLQKIAGVVERRQTLPILANILVNAGNGLIQLTATDLEVELKTEAKVECDGEADFTLPARKLLDICKALPESAPITLNVTEDKVRLQSGRSRFSLSLLPARDYPVIEPTPSNNVMSINENTLNRLIEKTQFAMAQQDVRYYLNGMLFEISKGDIRTVATDGHRLAMSQIKKSAPEEINQQIILPRKAVIELGRLLSNSDDEIKIEMSNSYIRVLLEKAVFTSKLIDGRFPEYQRVMPTGSDKEVEADKTSLRQSLTRASILSNEKYRGIRFELKENLLQLQAHNPEQEESEEELEVKYSGDELKIGFNVGYLLDAINAIAEDSIIIELKDTNSSALIYGKDNDESRYVVMPMRI